MREVNQSIERKLQAILTLSSSPVVGLEYDDVSVIYRKEGGSFAAKSLTPIAATLTSANAQNYVLTNGQTLIVEIDGGSAQTITFITAQFSDIGAATAAEVASAINSNLTGAAASASSGSVVITSSTTGDSSKVEVTGGTANTALGFSTTATTGSAYWYEIGSGLYEIRFTAAELNTLESFTYIVTGSTIDQYLGQAKVVAVTEDTTSSVAIDTCIVSGHLLDITGTPVEGAAVTARLTSTPEFIQNLALLSEGLVSTTTDANGYWTLTLPRLAYVDLFVGFANYRRSLVVPNVASIRLVDIE